MANVFDQFDDPAAQGSGRPSANIFDQFDQPAQGKAKDFGIDWHGEPKDVRAVISALPEVDQDEALRQWADAQTARERQAGFKTGAYAARGIPFIGPLLDEAAGALTSVPYYVSGGNVGRPYGENVELFRSRERAAHAESPIASFATEFAGGMMMPIPFLKGGDSLLKTTGKVAGFSGAAGTAAGAGSEGDLEQRFDRGVEGLQVGTALGAVLPPAAAAAGKGASVVYDKASPTLARMAAGVRALREKRGIKASADGGVPVDAGAEAAADQMIANQLYRAGKTVGDLERTIAEAQEARTFHKPGLAQDVLAPVDLDESLQRLAGSATRASPEASNRAQAFMYARQTGLTPQDGLPPGSGLPVRDMLSKPMTGAQTEKQLGRTFDTPDDKLVPMGQRERVTDALKRAFRIRDEEFHGHGANAYRTEQAMIKSLKDEADKLYPDAWAKAEDFDLTPAFEGLARKLEQLNDPKVGTLFQRVGQLFLRRDGNLAPLAMASELKKFDLAKQRLDGLIDKYRGKDSFVFGALRDFKNDLLNAVHGGNRLAPTRNAAYGEARGYYASQKEAQETIDLGRKAVRQDSDISADVFNSLETPALQKLFRLGLLSEADAKMASMPRGSDVTRLFDNPRIQEVLSAAIPRSEGKADVFANRPERFGKYLGSEKRMVQTRNEVSGNSKTAQRQADDEAFTQLSALSGGWERWKQSDKLSALGWQLTKDVLNKFFGMSADTSAALARHLFTADPTRRALLLERLRARMGDTRFTHFSRLMQEYQNAAIPAGVTAGTQ